MRKPRLVEQHEAAGKRILLDDLHVFVREEGEGEPVLLLHGMPSSSFLYRKMLSELAGQGHRAVCFDFPGVGLSDKPRDFDYGWRSLSKWVGRVVDALALPPVHLIWHDVAGPIGAAWAIRNPAKVHSITITNTMLDVSDSTPPFPMSAFRVPVLRHVVFSTLNPRVMLPIFRRSWVKNPDVVDEDVVASYIYLLRNNGGHHSFFQIVDGSALTEQDRDELRDGLLAIDRPMQLVWGEQEVGIPRTQLDYIKQAFPLWAVHMIDARHYLQEEHPAVLSAHIASFAKDIAQQSKRATNAAV